MEEQNFLRDEIKRLRWEEDITFKEIAEDLLDMNYHAFINWLSGRCNLGHKKIEQLTDYLDCMR